MPVKEESEGPTPHGGVRSEIYYQDQQGRPVDKSQAVRAEVVERDAEGHVIFRSYLNVEAKP